MSEQLFPAVIFKTLKVFLDSGEKGGDSNGV